MLKPGPSSIVKTVVGGGKMTDNEEKRTADLTAGMPFDSL